MKKLLILLLCFPLLFSSCRKDDVYELNEINATSYNANKNKLKSSNQFISILYANLFQEALSANELVEISRLTRSPLIEQIFLASISFMCLLSSLK